MWYIFSCSRYTTLECEGNNIDHQILNVQYQLMVNCMSMAEQTDNLLYIKAMPISLHRNYSWNSGTSRD